MKCVFTFLVFVLLTFLACKDNEEVLPIPPASEEVPAPVIPEEKTEEAKPPTDLQADVFQYGSFRGMPYRILFPRNYDSLLSYPLHVFLHGIGERGSDNEKQLSVGGSFYKADSIRSKYPAFVIFPQCPGDDHWFSDEITTKLKAFIDTLATHYLIMEDKITIGGFSMGGYGTFAMVARYPGFFESAVAISGEGDADKVYLMAKTKWQIFAGKKDDIVPAYKTKLIAEALKEAGASVSFILFQEADHGETWWYAFSQRDFFYKLFSIHEGRPEKISN